MSSFRETMLNSTVTVGSWLQLADFSLTEMMAKSGFDWLTIDLEHTTTSVDQMGQMIRIGDLAGVPMMVRLSGHDPVQIKRAPGLRCHWRHRSDGQHSGRGGSNRRRCLLPPSRKSRGRPGQGAGIWERV